MFGSTEPTDYDLQFPLFGIPVRVSIWFWLMAAILGYPAIHGGMQLLLAWILVVFVSVLVHELGHALVARSFGYSPRILLYQFGGLAMFEPWGNFSRGKSITISLAGPFAGFLLYGLTDLFIVFGLPALGPSLAGLSAESQGLIDFILGQLLYVNLYWGLINLLPVPPLDGGRVSQDVCSIFRRDAIRMASIIGVVVGGAFGVWMLTRGETYVAILFIMLAISNYGVAQQRGGW